MSATKVLGDKNLHLLRKESLVKHDKENADSIIKRRSSMVKSRPQSLAKEELTSSLSSSFTIFEEKAEVKDAAVQVSEQTTSNAVTDEEKAALNTDFITAEEPPAEYWKLVAETRRTALAEALVENEQLHGKLTEKEETITDLKKERETLKAKIAAMKLEISQFEEIVADAKKVTEMFEQYCEGQEDDEETAEQGEAVPEGDQPNE